MSKGQRWLKYWRFWVKWRGAVGGIGKTSLPSPTRHHASPDPTDADVQAEYIRRKSTAHSAWMTCRTCQKPLEGKRAHQQFCSGKCRTAYYRIKKALMEKGNG